jgi:hypothetical protein
MNQQLIENQLMITYVKARCIMHFVLSLNIR